MNIELTPEDQVTVDRLLQSGRYQSAQQIVHTSLEQLKEDEENSRRIRMLVQEGLDSAKNEPLITEEQLIQHLAERRRRKRA